MFGFWFGYVINNSYVGYKSESIVVLILISGFVDVGGFNKWQITPKPKRYLFGEFIKLYIILYIIK